MGKNIEGEAAEFCQECGAVESIKRTVPWQPDICSSCGSDISDSTE